jgi:hypothetical protein
MREPMPLPTVSEGVLARLSSHRLAISLSMPGLLTRRTLRERDIVNDLEPLFLSHSLRKPTVTAFEQSSNHHSTIDMSLSVCMYVHTYIQYLSASLWPSWSPDYVTPSRNGYQTCLPNRSRRR